MVDDYKIIKGDTISYAIYSDGRVKTCSRIGSRGYITKEKWMIPSKNSSGYLRVSLTLKIKNPKQYFVHRLVAENFVENPFDKNIVNHKDGNKLNNNYNNLEWCTSSENNLHAFKNKLKRPTILKGESHGGRILSWDNILFIRSNYKKRDKEYGQCGLAKMFNTSQSHIYDIVNNNIWKTKN